jgi:hypothetical protein
MRPPQRELYARARGLDVEEVPRLLAVIPGDSAAGLCLILDWREGVDANAGR